MAGVPPLNLPEVPPAITDVGDTLDIVGKRLDLRTLLQGDLAWLGDRRTWLDDTDPEHDGDRRLIEQFLKDLERRTLTNVDVDIGDIRGGTLLHVACRLGNQNAAAKLIEGGADVNKKDLQGRTPLFMASVEDNVYRTSLTELLIDCGADVNETDNYGRTPLNYLCETTFLVPNGHDGSPDKKILAMLINPATINRADISGKTPLLNAVENNYTNTVEFLMGCGADTSRPAPGLLTPLEIAVSKGHGMVAEVLRTSQHGGDAYAKRRLPRRVQQPVHEDTGGEREDDDDDDMLF